MKPVIRFNEQFDAFGINRKIVKRELGHGDFGLFAIEPITKGEIIYFEDNELHQWDEVVLSVAEIAQLSGEKFRIFWRYATQCGLNQLAGPLTLTAVEKDIGYFMNHSCDPTCWYIHDEAMEARRDVRPDEEITYDYCTSDVHTQGFSCNCGAANCRRQVTGNDWQLMKPIYGDHYLTYINELARHLANGCEQTSNDLKHIDDSIRKMEASFVFVGS